MTKHSIQPGPPLSAPPLSSPPLSPPPGQAAERPRFRRYSMSSRYLWVSLLAALVPLLSFAALYDSYFSELVSRLTDERLATRTAATKNEFQVYLNERRYELAALVDQFDTPGIFTEGGSDQLSPTLRDLLILQAEQKALYGVAFFDADQNLVWTFPDGALSRERYDRMKATPAIDFEGAQLIGPEPPSWDRPPVLLMKQSVALNGGTVNQNGTGNRDHTPAIGLIVRFNSLAAIAGSLQVDGVIRPRLSLPDGRTYDTVGQLVSSPETLVGSYPLLPGWYLELEQTRALVEPSSARMRYVLILLVTGTASFLLIIHLVISRRLKRQMDALIESVEHVANGDLETPVAQSSSREVKALAESIERMRHQLKQVIRSTLEVDRQASLGKLAAGLAHDIRNPLTTMLTTLQALIKREPNASHREMLAMLEDEVQRVNEVIGNLLNFARPREPQAEPILVPQLLDSLTALVTASARRQNVTLTVNCPANLTVHADAGQLRQILMNLVLNALQALPHGGQVWLDAEAIDQTVRLSVRDNGPGIPEHQHQRVIEPFFTTKSTGTGLGLAICHTLAVKNGGRLTIESTPGQGATVSIRFPIGEGMELEA